MHGNLEPAEHHALTNACRLRMPAPHSQDMCFQALGSPEGAPAYSTPNHESIHDCYKTDGADHRSCKASHRHPTPRQPLRLGHLSDGKLLRRGPSHQR